MTIAEAREKCKSALGRIPRDVLIMAILLLASSASFGLGYLAGRDGGEGSGRYPDATPLMTAATSSGIFASKNGTKYYLPGCTGADRISDANKVWFVSALAARSAGYAPAAGCKGL